MTQLSEANLRGYLLRDLPESEQTEVEDQLFTQVSAVEQLSVVEDELIDAYVRNELAERDRISFETHFVTSSRRAERVKMAELLLSRATALKTPDAGSLRMPHAALGW